MRHTFKLFAAAIALISTVGTANAKELIVTGDEAKDVMAMGDETVKLLGAMMPCLKQNTEQVRNGDIYKVYNMCICEKNNTAAISSMKSLEAIYNKHNNWASYSSVKVEEKSGDLTTSSSIDLSEFKKVLESVRSCLR